MRQIFAVVLSTVCLAACEQPQVKTAPQVEDAPPVMPVDAPPQEEIVAPLPLPPTSTHATDGSCRSELGDVAATRLVDRCIAVSPATRPPCNAANPCALIQGEIDRACEMFPDGPGKPTECGA